MNTSNNSGETSINVEFPDDRVVTFSEQPNELNGPATVPLLLNPSYSRSKSSIFDELRAFRISLKWCALDHSSYTSKSISYIVFIILTIVVPIVSTVFINLPASDPISFNRIVQLPESGLAIITFFTLTRFFQRYGLRQLLFLDELQDDMQFVRRGYARELDKAFRHLVWILLPSFFGELAHKILFFSTVTVSIPHFVSGVTAKYVVFIAVLASWVYRTGVFLVVCVFFKLTCELQILRFEGLKMMFEGCGTDSGVIFSEHKRIRKQLSFTSHRYRLFIIMCIVTITVSQLGALLFVLASKSEKNFFNSGDLVVCSAVQLSGFFLCLIGAARITHRVQGVVSIATKWHMYVTCSSSPRCNACSPKDQTVNAVATVNHESHNGVSGWKSSDTSTIPKSFFKTRQALVTYLQHNSKGITLYGFTLDRGLLHTLFAFEMSLVLWILSKVVVLA